MNHSSYVQFAHSHRSLDIWFQQASTWRPDLIHIFVTPPDRISKWFEWWPTQTQALCESPSIWANDLIFTLLTWNRAYISTKNSLWNLAPAPGSQSFTPWITVFDSSSTRGRFQGTAGHRLNESRCHWFLRKKNICRIV